MADAVWSDEIARIGQLGELTATRVAALRSESPLIDYHILGEPPFVVIGNEPAARVEQRARTTLRWAALQFQTVYARERPRQVIEVWLLRDRASYDALSKSRWGLTPISPFGYFLPEHQIVVVQLESGAGTLVHEMFHALMSQDFPNCPPWFQEGLASLYEECTSRDGRIWGLPNWRLRGLQRRIGAAELPRFAQLFGMSREDFYGAAAPVTCAQARYLCLYLQDREVLATFYHEFQRNALVDPTGMATFQRVAQVDDLLDFQQQWQQYVMALHEPITERR